jgi:tryptophanyl-tRNA synthetase
LDLEKKLKTNQVIELALAVTIIRAKVGKGSSGSAEEENNHNDLKDDGDLVVHIHLAPLKQHLWKRKAEKKCQKRCFEFKNQITKNNKQTNK